MNKGYFRIGCLVTYFLYVLLLGSASAATDITEKDLPQAVVVDGKELFQVMVRVGSFSPQDRADIISGRVEKIAKNYAIDIETIHVQEIGNTMEIVAGKQIIMSITDVDAQAEQQTLIALADERMDIIKSTIKEYRIERSTKNMSLYSLGTIALTGLLWRLVYWLQSLLKRMKQKLAEHEISESRYSFKIQKFEVLSSGQIYSVVSQMMNISIWVLQGILIYFYLFSVLSIFPGTRKYAHQLLGYILEPIMMVLETIVSFLPNVSIIIVIIIISRYFLQGVHLFFNHIKQGNIKISGFYIEWVDPTYKIVRFLVLALTLISIFPYIPGSQSAAFQGVSVFIGVLFSLGSSSTVSNIVAGIAITYTRAFSMGDRVKIGEHIGDIIEKTLLVTRIRTIKNVDIIIPNSSLLNGSITNYSTGVGATGLILHSTITIGYDVPWRIVHELLIKAAYATPDILVDPKPFVFQTSLDDFYVSYQINAYTQKPNSMARIYSDLHKNIQDSFNDANVEIMSPHYTAIRDGNQTTIPAENLPEDYAKQVFEIKIK